MQTLEGKLNTLRIILAANLVVLLALFTYAYLQAQELAQTHKDLQALRVQAQSAVGALTPSLDARLNVFEKRMDMMDAKVATAQDHLVKGMDEQAKIAEDHMAQRMNAEIPAMLDEALRRLSHIYVLTGSVESGFFLRKNPLRGMIPVYSNWRTSIAACNAAERTLWRTRVGCRRFIQVRFSRKTFFRLFASPSWRQRRRSVSPARCFTTSWLSADPFQPPCA
jgi:hypothetical protein